MKWLIGLTTIAEIIVDNVNITAVLVCAADIVACLFICHYITIYA